MPVMRRAFANRVLKVFASAAIGFGLAVSVWLGLPAFAHSAVLGSGQVSGATPSASDGEPPPPAAAPVTPVIKAVPGEEEPGLGLEGFDGEDLTAPDVEDDDGNFDPDASKIVHRSDEEMLLLEVQLSGLVIADAMPGYLNGSSLLLPLRDVVEVLEFPIGVDVAAGTASGWFIKENKLFYINVRRGSVVVEGRQLRFEPGMVELHPDDIYVDVRKLSKWFPLDIRFDISNMLVEVKSREPLAIEQKLARDQYRKRMFSAKKDTENLPRVYTPHKFIDWPMVSVDTETRLNKPQDGEVTFFTDYNLLSSSDLGYGNAELFVAGNNDDKVTETRFKLERKDPGGKILGEGLPETPITEFAVGDVYSPEIPQVSRTQLGRGFTVSSLPIDTPTEFDKITLDGDLPLGWEVELFRNEVLIAFQTSSADGRYSFGDVPLLFGVNVLKLIFYGPQGQTREEIKQFRVGESLVKPGDIQFRATANQHDARLLYKKRTTHTSLDGDIRFFGEAQLGVTQNVSVGANVSVVPQEDYGQQRYLGLSTSTTLGNIYTRGEVTKQQGGGVATRLSGQTGLAGISVIAQHDRYYNYFSEYTPDSGDPLTSVSKLRLDGSIPETVIPRIPFGITIDHSRRSSKATETRVTNRMSQAIGPTSVTSSLTGTMNKSGDGEINKSASGSFLVGGRVDDFRVRGQMGYEIAPVKKLTTVSLSGDWVISQMYQGNASVTRTLGDQASTAYSMGLNTAFDQLSAGLAFDYTNTQEMVAKLTMNFSLTRDPGRGAIEMARGNIATKGAMTARVFLDHDANGEYSDGDEPLDGIGFTADNMPLKGRTDEKGNAYIKGLEAYREIAFKVDLVTLADPYWIAQPGGIRIVPRPGTTAQFDFPIVSTGEVDGTVFRIWRDGPGSVAGVVVQLLKEDGTLVRELESAYDGFFLFDFVAPGRYKLRVSPEQMSTLGLGVDQEYALEIDGGGTIVSGKDFVLQ